MEIKREDPSKVIIIPRPPRSMEHDMVPIQPAGETAEVEDGQTPPTPPAAVEGSGNDPLNNQVQGPAQGLAGAPQK